MVLTYRKHGSHGSTSVSEASGNKASPVPVSTLIPTDACLNHHEWAVHDKPLAGLKLDRQWPTGHQDTMTAISATGLIYLLCSALMSAGRLLPPQNLTVDMLDFKGKAKWDPDPGNPPHTTYTVELQPIGEAWTESCTGITATKCPLMFNLTLDDLLKSYYVRVKAMYRGESSTWTNHDTIQPYGDTLLSAPIMHLSYRERNISIHIDMPQSVLTVRPQLKYFIQVFEETDWLNVSGKCIKGESGESSRVCMNLTPGQNYCVKASAVLAQQQRKQHLYSRDCISLPNEASAILWHAVMGALLLLAVIVTLTLAALHYYLKPRASELHMPKSLKMVRGASGAVATILSEVPILTMYLWHTSASLESCVTPPGKQPFVPCEYELRSWHIGDEESIGHSDVLPGPTEQESTGNQLLPAPCTYLEALDNDGDRVKDWDEDGDKQGYRSCSPEGTGCTAEALLREQQGNGRWQLEQAPSLDVPMTSLSLCIDSGEEASREAREIDSDGEGGANVDEGAELLGCSFRDSLGYLPGALENFEDPYTKRSISTYISGYEPRPEPSSQDPFHSALRMTLSPASPLFEQSVLYLKR
ncbi:hypothetical protein MATL_G00039560 [Megalops atlanticus]|uniref:Fibronectin type-III domain-containing protein n=1 Tax=Megalops atlanticus TaxID=7932 RepID=A0A9D3QE18_MEGAT|nr:hypothetical protein MATL_G00039560 [Megalops atlanticus]